MIKIKMKIIKITLLSTFLLAFTANSVIPSPMISGEMKKWHKITITFDGPDTSEDAAVNPFLNYRLNVTFKNTDKTYTVPGFYAADGNAAQSSSISGNKWQVHFTPDKRGFWSYKASFRKGSDIAIDPDPEAGSPVSFDSIKGQFKIAPTDKAPPDFRARGMLNYIGEHYLQFAETKEYFLKGGADSPENFLAYFEFDGTFDIPKKPKKNKKRNKRPGSKFLHHYNPHKKDWKKGDPVWQNKKGKNIIGALNYLASKGMNSVYFLTYNIDKGDGMDTWPWTGPEERFRFDCSKLAQWEIIFSHMDSLGLVMHLITQETENDQALDKGKLGRQRKLYYQELIARFAHHLGLIWNLGEENTNTEEEQKAFASFFKRNDPYTHPIVLHTAPGPKKLEKIYTPLLGYKYLDGPSIQLKDAFAHRTTKKWIKKSSQSKRKWFVCIDEPGNARRGIDPDDRTDENNQDEMRKKCLWGNLMAGGSGVEWFFGYKNHNHDLNCEDWRSRERVWNFTRYALDFFHKYLPFYEMASYDELTSQPYDFCFAKLHSIYAVYLPDGGTTEIDLENQTAQYTVKWYNPRKGGTLSDGSIKKIKGPGKVEIGYPPYETDKDWAVLIKR